MPEVESVKVNLPWVEKYRPKGLDELISHVDVVKTLDKYISEQLPHLLFYGPPGTGKTSTILACAKKMYSSSQLNSMVLELNASDDRGIGIVRGVILNFASTRTIFKGGFKLIILDEADAMTSDAQNALRRNGVLNGGSHGTLQWLMPMPNSSPPFRCSLPSNPLPPSGTMTSTVTHLPFKYQTAIATPAEADFEVDGNGGRRKGRATLMECKGKACLTSPSKR